MNDKYVGLWKRLSYVIYNSVNWCCNHNLCHYRLYSLEWVAYASTIKEDHTVFDIDGRLTSNLDSIVPYLEIFRFISTKYVNNRFLCSYFIHCSIFFQLIWLLHCDCRIHYRPCWRWIWWHFSSANIRNIYDAIKQYSWKCSLCFQLARYFGCVWRQF